jgi:hypothetical protein
MNPQPHNREPGRVPVVDDDDLDLRLPADEGGGDEDGLPDDAEHDGIGQARDGSEDVGLDTSDGSDEPIELAVTDEDEQTRWTEGSEVASDIDADPDLLSGAEDGWTEGAEPLDDIDMGVEVDDDDDDEPPPIQDGGEEGLSDEGSFDGISKLPPLDAGTDDDEDEDGDEPFARELLLEVAGDDVADDDVLVDASGRTWSRAPATSANVEVVAELEGLVARERPCSCLTREGERLRWWSRAADGTLMWSDDCGEHWSGARVGPRVAWLCSDGARALAMLARDDGGVRLHCSSDNGRTWDARDLPEVDPDAITALAVCRDVVVVGCSAPEPKLFVSVAAGAWRELGVMPPCLLLLEDERVVLYACLAGEGGTPLVRYPLQGGTPPLVAAVLEGEAVAPLALCGVHEAGATALHVWTARAWLLVRLGVRPS